MYCVSTSTPIELVIAQPSAHSALSAGAQQRRHAPGQQQRLRDPDRKPADRALDDEVTEARAVADGRRPDAEAHGQAGRRGGDPAGRRRTAGAEAPRLDGAEDRAGDGAAHERRGDPVDRAGDAAPRRGRRAGSRGTSGASAARSPAASSPSRRRHAATSSRLERGAAAVRRRSWSRITIANAISHTLQST